MTDLQATIHLQKLTLSLQDAIESTRALHRGAGGRTDKLILATLASDLTRLVDRVHNLYPVDTVG